MKLLIVEDDLLLQEGLALAFNQDGYTLDLATTASQAEQYVRSAEYSLIILDLGLPDQDGAILLRHWRKRGIKSPVMILTARDALKDRVNVLDSGADDYLTKPFALVELQARARALIRRHEGHSDNLLQDNGLTLNLQTQQVVLDNQVVDITPKEFSILIRLMMRLGQTVHRETLQQDIYSWQDDLGSNTLEVHIHNLRRKLGKERIKTIRGIGYRLESHP